jgi:hypothetical protein
VGRRYGHQYLETHTMTILVYLTERPYNAWIRFPNRNDDVRIERLSIEELAGTIYKIAVDREFPEIAVEVNGGGIMLLQALMALQYPRLYTERGRQIGWVRTPNYGRSNMFQEMIERDNDAPLS